MGMMTVASESEKKKKNEIQSTNIHQETATLVENK